MLSNFKYGIISDRQIFQETLKREDKLNVFTIYPIHITLLFIVRFIHLIDSVIDVDFFFILFNQYQYIL